MDLLIEPAKEILGEVNLPGDKSISHRAIMCASLASGTSIIEGFLESEDCLATVKVFQSLGVEIKKKGEQIEIEGRGLKGLSDPKKDLYFGNSGTAIRLISGIMVGQDFNSLLTGDESLLKRPMNRITVPLNSMGFSIKAQNNGSPPLKISKVNKASSIKYQLPIASAQVKSCLMFASLYSEGSSEISEEFQTRDHTERMFKEFGIPIDISYFNGTKTIRVEPPSEIKPRNLKVCSDFSSSAFFIVAALISKNSDLLIKNVGINKTRIGLVKVLLKMGASINIQNISDEYEPTADIRVKSSKLQGLILDKRIISNLIDELPVLFIAAAFAEGVTKIRGIEELRFKESDRLEAMALCLKSFGVSFSLKKNGIDILGINEDNSLKKAEIDSFGDHRIAMAAVIGSLRSKGVCKIKNCENINTSFPNFLEVSNKVGINIEKV